MVPRVMTWMQRNTAVFQCSYLLTLRCIPPLPAFLAFGCVRSTFSIAHLAPEAKRRKSHVQDMMRDREICRTTADAMLSADES